MIQFFPLTPADFPFLEYLGLGILFFVSLVLAWNKGAKKRLAFSLCVGLYFLYEFFVPVFDAVKGCESFFGFSIVGNRALHIQVFLVYLVGIISLIFSYWLISKWFSSIKWQEIVPNLTIGNPEKAFKSIVIYQSVVWILVVFNIHQSGVSLISLLDFQNQSEKDILFSIHWHSHGIDLLSNSLSVALFLQFWIKRKTDWTWWAFFISWLTFCLLAGWRYRIILLMLFFVIYFLRTTKLSAKSILAICIFMFFSVSWLTLNRMAIAKRQFHLVTFDFSQFDSEILATELSNSRTFKASLIYLKTNQLARGGLPSWLEYIGNKFLPKNTFPNGKRPAPWIIGATKNWIPPGWPWNPNPAVNQMEEYFLTFGWVGLVVGMILMGIWVAFLDFPSKNSFLISFQMIGTGLCFQWISRGFFLYQIQIALASFLPFLVLYFVARYLPHDKIPDTTGPV